VLYILIVICSLSQERASLAEKVLDQIALLNDEINTKHKTVLIDNGSTFKSNFQQWTFIDEIFEFEQNIGYWNAISWFLDFLTFETKVSEHDYIYIVESDNLHYQLKGLNEIVSLMDRLEFVDSVRVQEFKVRLKHLYFKENKLLPFRRRRSLVSKYNAVDKKQVWFVRFEGCFFLTNMHAKLPAVSRLATLQRVFVELRELKEITEWNFFAIMNKYSPLTGLYDGGIYYTLSTLENAKLVEAGSYLEEYAEESRGYRNTRHEIMLSNFDNLVFRKYNVNQEWNT
jgi:hypothetical protein